MSVNIAICDDEKTSIDYLTNIVKSWGKSRKIKASLFSFYSAESFLFSYSESSFDIILLDIQMSGLNGVELAKQIRKDNDAVQIVFVTGLSDFIAEGYEVFALHYLMKPVSEDKLFYVLDRAVKTCLKPIG